MLSKLHSRLGTAGFVVAIVALVAAVGGTAIAATGLNSKQKKEVKSIAKSVAGTGAPGPAGPVGPAGSAGAQGPAGAPGQNGVGATTTAFNGNKGACTEGGLEVKSESPVALLCNGKKGGEGPEGPEGPEGDPWTAGGTLPPNATETGTWGTAFSEVGFAPVSFPIPLANPLAGPKTIQVPPGGPTPPECDNGANPPATAANPEADPGFLCVYVTNAEPEGTVIGSISNPVSGATGAATVGASLLLQSAGPAFMLGTFAVTAPVNP